jgi:hypothetical protein
MTGKRRRPAAGVEIFAGRRDEARDRAAITKPTIPSVSATNADSVPFRPPVRDPVTDDSTCALALSAAADRLAPIVAGRTCSSKQRLNRLAGEKQ